MMQHLQASASSQATMVRPTSPGPASLSTFSLQSMPRSVQPREPHPFSVHFSMETRKWVATISKGPDTGASDGKKCVQFLFHSERDAKKFCRAYAPPKMRTPSTACSICNRCYSSRSQPHHCRNCGAACCDKCTTRWGVRMIPKTFVGPMNGVTARVCRTCDWLSNAFCMALIQGKYDDALVLYSTKNVNLRTSFADINREAMFPVHCAVMGGNLELLKWLVDGQLCPLSVQRQVGTGHPLSVQTSAERTLIDIAMTGRPKLDILCYLVAEKNLTITDTKDPKLAPRTLEGLLRAGIVIKPDTNADAMEISDHPAVHLVDSSEESLATIEDACIICCEKPMDSVLIPCGHQVCCQDCGKHLTACPVCKIQCSVLRIFRQ